MALNPSSARSLFQNAPSGRTNRGVLMGGRGSKNRMGFSPNSQNPNLGPTVMSPTPDDTGSSPQGKSGLTRAWTGPRNGDGSPNLANASPAVKGVQARAQATSTYAGDRNSPELAANIASGKITPGPGLNPGAPQTMTPPPPTATTNAAQETESANPLTGTSNDLPMGKTQTLPSTPAAPTTDINHARALGFSARGQQTPTGDDIATPGATPDADAAMNGNPGSTPDTQTFNGGMGAYSRSFSNPQSANIYHDYVKKLFGSAPPQQPGQVPSMLAKSPAAAPTPGAQDDE